MLAGAPADSYLCSACEGSACADRSAKGNTLPV